MPKRRVPFTPGDLDHRQRGTDDILTGDPTTNILIGDAGGSMFDFSKGGNDTFMEEAPSNYTFYGDAVGSMFDFARGGDDTFAGLTFSTTTAYGDAGDDMSDHSKDGNDTFNSGMARDVNNAFYGDAGGNISGHAQGRDDVAVLQGATNFVYGDAITMLGNAVGGNDTLTGGRDCRPVIVFTILPYWSKVASNIASAGQKLL
jgi:hypothetical protein